METGRTLKENIVLGVGLLVTVLIMIFLTDIISEETTVTNNTSDEGTQLRDEIDRLYNDAMEDSYINESEGEKVKRVGQKIGMMMDDELLELGIVDNNYEYKDVSSAIEYFELVTINHQKTLPDTSDGITSKEAELTRYFNTYTYVIEEFLPPESVEAIRATSQSQEYIQGQCDVFYASKYQRANGTSVSIKVYDLSGDLISKVLLDESRCD